MNWKRSIFLLLIITLFPLSLNAAPAKVTPITVTQPDGTTFTMVMHGDEFLHWATAGNSLVAQGEDGWWYYASFDDDGNSIPGTQKVSNNVILQAPGDYKVVPPSSAIEKANQRRGEMSLRRSSASGVANNGISGAPSTIKNSISLGSDKKFLVILVDFTDVKFSVGGGGEKSRQAFDNLMNQNGYSSNGGHGSVTDYFKESSSSKFIPQFDVYGPVQLEGNLAKYSKNDGMTESGVPAIQKEACMALDSNVDFSKYDNDKDGLIDNVFIFYPGYSAAEGAAGTIWPHQWGALTWVELDGVYLDCYACGSEYRGASGKNMVGIGTCCHEFGHTIGLPDFYDTDYEENGENLGLDDFSVMAYGVYNDSGRRPPYHNCEEKYLLGWNTARPIPSGSVSLKPVQEGGSYYVPTSKDGEYYLYEFRNGKGWDTGLDKGVMIYHVDKSNNKIKTGVTAADTWVANTINAYSTHPCMKMICASNSYYPFGKSVSKYTSAKDWAGNNLGFDLTNISYTDNSASLTFDTSSITASGSLKDADKQPIVGATISVYIPSAQTLQESPSLSAPSSVTLVKTLTTDKDGHFTLSSEGLIGKDVTITVHKDGYLESSQTFYFLRSKSVDFTLLKTSESEKSDKEILALSDIKYVDIPSQSYKEGDKFTLSIDNSETSPYSAIEWEVDSVPQPDGSQITLKTGITDIKATLTYPSGKMDVILMQIIIEK